jgi:hypothetical protein
MGLYDEASKVAADYLKAAYKGEKVNGSKKAINAIVNNGFGGLEAVGRFLGGEGTKSLENTFAKEGADGIRSSANGWDAGKIAGSYIGVATAGRVLSGGGAYKDGNGNTNLVGVPFV